MAEKKNNTTRNLAIGAGTVLAGGLALKSGGLKKAYNALSRLGKKRGKYKTSNNDAKKENVTQYINRIRGKTKLTKAEKSALLKERREKLDYGEISFDMSSTKPTNVREVILDPKYQGLKDAAYESDIASQMLVAQKVGLIPKGSGWNKRETLDYKKRKGNELKEQVDILRLTKNYSRKLYLISDFTLR